MTDIEPPHGRKRRGFPWILVVFPALGLLVFVAIWQFLAPSDRRVMVAYSDFVAEVRAGRVEEIQIRDREIRFRTRGLEGRPGVIKETVGPIPDQRLLDSLKPDDPAAAPPKIVLETK